MQGFDWVQSWNRKKDICQKCQKSGGMELSHFQSEKDKWKVIKIVKILIWKFHFLFVKSPIGYIRLKAIKALKWKGDKQWISSTTDDFHEANGLNCDAYCLSTI